MTVENVGEARVQVLASWFNVAVGTATPAASDSPRSDGVKQALEQEFNVLALQPHRAGHVMTTAYTEIVSSGELLARGWWFEPREKSHLPFLTYADPKSGDVLRVSVGAFVARGSRLTLAPSEDTFGCTADPAPIDTTVWTSIEPAVIRRFSTPEVRLAYGWIALEDGSIWPVACYAVGETWHEIPERSADDPVIETIDREYGLALTGSESELSLWPAAPVASPLP